MSSAKYMFKTAQKNDLQLQEDAKDSTKSRLDKGKLALGWFIKEKAGAGEIWASVTNRMQASQEMEKKEKWKPESEMIRHFGQDEFNAHLNSGRMSWRECAKTPGVYEYMDIHDFESKKRFQKSKDMARGQARDKDEEYGEIFKQVYDFCGSNEP